MEKKAKKAKIDGQLVELAGRNWLVSQLIRAGIEVARPERDRGVDLVAYFDRPKFTACPIQLKAASKRSFTVYDKKYQGMLLVYVWYVSDSTKTVAYALTFTETRKFASERGWTTKPCWRKYGYWRENHPGTDLQLLLEPYKMAPNKWMAMVRQSARKRAKPRTKRRR